MSAAAVCVIASRAASRCLAFSHAIYLVNSSLSNHLDVHLPRPQPFPPLPLTLTSVWGGHYVIQSAAFPASQQFQCKAHGCTRIGRWATLVFHGQQSKSKCLIQHGFDEINVLNSHELLVHAPLPRFMRARKSPAPGPLFFQLR